MRLIVYRLSITVAVCFMFTTVACTDDEPTPADPDPATGISDSSDTEPAPDSDVSDADTQTDTGSDEGPDCVPAESSWEATIEPIVDEYCGECHGDTPQHGAPVSLTDYDVLVAGEQGDRKVDAMVDELIDFNMPPPGSPEPSHSELDALVAWASCGEEHPDYGDQLVASAPVWEAPEDAPDGLDYFDLTADEYPVADDQLDEYRCFGIEVPVTDDQFIRRIEPIIDDGRVLHHSLVSIDRSGSVQLGDFSCPAFPPGDDYLYAWGPGQTAMQFDDGGIRVQPGDRMVLQIHYNNGAGFQDVVDSSGLRIFHESTDGTEHSMDQFQTMSINIPPEEEWSTTTSCTVQRDTELVATWPHMHEIGSEFEQVVHRSDGSTDTVVELTGWHFEAQYLYETPMQLQEGDVMEMTCTWDNPHDHSVSFGTGTEDEMCFSFMYFASDHSSFCS